MLHSQVAKELRKRPDELSQSGGESIEQLLGALAEYESNQDILLAELQWAWEHLRFEIPYPNEESEFEQCVICGNPDFDHKPDCQAIAHKEFVKNLYPDTESE